MDESKNYWWGYKQISGTYQAKRYWPGEATSKAAVQDAHDSDFVDQVVEAFPANSREEALKYVKEHTN